MDQNTLYSDPDPEFWPNLDTDPKTTYVVNFGEKMFKIEQKFLCKTYFF